MAKASSPVRLDASLMQDAKVTGELQKRSAAQQIEYWASIGRSVAKWVDPETLLKIRSGLTTLRVEPQQADGVDADSVFNDLQKEREKGSLASRITSTAVRYQASDEPGIIEQVDQQGRCIKGRFENGQFIPA